MTPHTFKYRTVNTNQKNKVQHTTKTGARYTIHTKKHHARLSEMCSQIPRLLVTSTARYTQNT